MNFYVAFRRFYDIIKPYVNSEQSIQRAPAEPGADGGTDGELENSIGYNCRKFLSVRQGMGRCGTGIRKGGVLHVFFG